MAPTPKPIERVSEQGRNGRLKPTSICAYHLGLESCKRCHLAIREQLVGAEAMKIVIFRKGTTYTVHDQ